MENKKEKAINYLVLQKKYPDKFVALVGDKVIDFDDNVARLTLRVGKKYFKKPDSAIAFVPSDEVVCV